METVHVLLHKYVKTAWRWRWAAVGVAWLVCGAGWFAVYEIPNQFEASARVFVDTDAVLTPLLRGIAADTSPSGQLDILQRTLLSRPNLEQLIAKTDLDLSLAGADDRERLVQNLANAIKVVPQTRTLFTISYRNTDPRLAYNVVQTLLTLFMERATGSNRADMENARRFLEHQIASYELQLRAAERRRADYQSKYMDVLPSENGGLSYLAQLRVTLKSLQGQLADALARRNELNKELGATPPMMVAETPSASVNARLVAAEQQLAELRLRYTESHPDVVAQKKIIATLRANPNWGITDPNALESSVGTRNRSVPNPVYEQLKIRLVDTEAQISSLQRQLTEGSKEVEALDRLAHAEPELQAQFQALNRDYNVLRRNYEELLQRREAAKIAQAADTQADKVKLQIIDPPQVPRIPVAPKRVMLLSGVLLAGLGAGAAFALLLGQFDQSFRTLDQLRSIGPTVIGGISILRPPTPRRNVVAALGFCVAILLLGVIYGGLVSRVLGLSKII
ncbi:MAG: hypothetical protein JOY71_06265 [Acetobacteraceae bacterium]|nr:hypothetical protein [Acetobacteraceae bacterium]